MFKGNNEDTRTTPMSLLLTLNIFHTCSIVFIVNFERVIAGWAQIISLYTIRLDYSVFH